MGNTPALAGAYYRTLYAHIEEPVSVFYVHSTPFVVVNEVSAVKTVLSGSGGAFIKPRYFGYRSTAVRAAKAMGLNVCGVDLLRSNHGPVIMEVNSSPGLEGIENATGKDIAGMIIEFIEGNAKPGKTKTKGKG